MDLKPESYGPSQFPALTLGFLRKGINSKVYVMGLRYYTGYDLWELVILLIDT